MLITRTPHFLTRFIKPTQEVLLHAELDIYEQFALEHCHVSAGGGGDWPSFT